MVTIAPNGMKIRNPAQLAGLNLQLGVPAIGLPASHTTPELALEGRTLYTLTATLPPSHEGRNSVEHILDAVRPQLKAACPDCPRLTRESVIEVPASRFGGLSFRQRLKLAESWDGDLRWRAAHPGLRGSAVTTRLYIEERAGWTRLSVLVASDIPTTGVREFFSAGDAQPAFIARLRKTVGLQWMGSEALYETLGGADIPDFVSSVLSDPSRQFPIVLLSPFENGGGFAVDPAQLATTLFGRARLWVLENQAATFKLTDAVGDQGHSCFWGAMRAYMPGWSPRDDHRDHPRLLADMVSDPVVRAQWVGELGLWLAARAKLPPALDSQAALPTAEPAALPARPAERAGGRPDRVTAVSHVMEPQRFEGSGPQFEVREPLEVEPAAPDLRRVGSDPEAPVPSHVGAFIGEEILSLMRALRDDQATLIEQAGDVAEKVTETASDIEDLRVLSRVRSANTRGIERRLERLEDLMERLFGVGDYGESERTTARTCVEEEPISEDRGLTLREVVLRASEAFADDLLILPSAVESAMDSPFRDVERVEGALEAMAQISRRRREGSYENVPLRVAFTALEQEYRGGVAETTSARLMQQYRFRHESIGEFEAVEHLVFGKTYDPRRCLRIYFSTKLPGEPRFVIGHIGRHFEVLTSS